MAHVLSSTDCPNVKELLEIATCLESGLSFYTEQKDVLELKCENLTKEKEDAASEIETLKAKVHKLEEIIANNLKKIKKAKKDNESHQKERKKLKAENSKLKLNNIDKDIKVKKLEDEDDLKLLKQKNKYCQLVDVWRSLNKINPQASAIANQLAKQTIDNKYEYEEELEKYISECDQCKQTLEKQGISIQERVFKLVNHFRNVCKENETRRTNTFEIAHEIDKSFKQKLKELEKNISVNIEDAKSVLENQEKELNRLRQVTFLDHFVTERNLFQYILKVANEEVLFYNNLLQASGAGTNEPEKRQASKSFNNLINSNLQKTKDYCIMMIALPESKLSTDDFIKVKGILKRLCLKDIISFTCCRIGKKKKDLIRPLVVKLKGTDTQYFDEILTKSSEKSWFTETGIHITKYENSLK